MKSKLTWKCPWFKNTSEIYENGRLVGKLTESCFKQTAEGELHGKRYTFKTSGFLKQETVIIDNTTNSIIGKITYNSWKTRAEISYSDKMINLRYGNAWNTRWNLFDANGVHYSFKGSSSKGTVEFEELNEFLVLCGLYIANYYWQTSIAVLVAVFVPIFVTISK
jgi:hypothetical protein